MQRLVLGPNLRIACIVLQIIPLPGVGAIIAGARNPHSRFLKNGIAQLALVVFGSYPLIIFGAIGLVWAIWDAVRIAQWSDVPSWSYPTPDADPATLISERDIRREARRAERAEKAAARAATKADKAAERARRAEEKARGDSPRE